MNRTVLILVAAVLGVGAAAFMIRTPDTGGAVDAPPVRAAGEAEEVDDGPIVEEAPTEGSRVTDENSQPPRPEAVALAERRTENDAMLVGMQGSAWTMVKRETALLSGEKSKAYLTEINDLVRALRESRLTPDTQIIRDLQTKQADLRARMKADGITSPGIETQFNRLDELSKRYPLGETAPADGATPVSAPTQPSSEL